MRRSPGCTIKGRNDLIPRIGGICPMVNIVPLSENRLVLTLAQHVCTRFIHTITATTIKKLFALAILKKLYSSRRCTLVRSTTESCTEPTSQLAFSLLTSTPEYSVRSTVLRVYTPLFYSIYRKTKLLTFRSVNLIHSQTNRQSE
jgi:hypothetical protein